MKPVAIIGAGITGLTAGFYLKRKGIPVCIYEAAGRVGGVIQSARQNGYLAEFGPNTILETSNEITTFIAEAGLQGRRLETQPEATARYVVRYRRPIEMPGSPLGFLTSGLFTLRAKLAVLREPFVPRRRDGKEESVAEFVRRRLGREILDNAIDTLVAGIYAGDPEKLSLAEAFPKLRETEARYGSLIRGQIRGARERKQTGEVARDRAPKFSFDEGLQVLPDTLRAHLGEAVRLETSVRKVAQTSDGWTLTLRQDGAEKRADHSAVVYAGTAFKLAELQLQTQPVLSFSSFAEIRHPPVASIVLGFRREDVAHPCQGFGMLIPKVEGFRILGTIFSSSLFPNRAPAGHLLLSSYAGGERNPELAGLPADKLVALACEDLRTLLGVKGEPIFKHVAFYPRAIPQYNLGYGRFLKQMDEAEAKAPGLFLAGHYRDGVSLSASIVSGIKASERIAAHLSSRQIHLNFESCRAA